MTAHVPVPGSTLASARESRGLTPAQAAEQMRLPPETILAMEEGRFGELGPAVFARGHLRKYAAMLGVPADGLITAYDASSQRALEPSLIPPASAHTPVRPEGVRRLRPWQAWIAVLLAVILLAVGAWLFWPGPGTNDSGTESVPAPATAPVEVPAAAPDSQDPGGPEAGEATAATPGPTSTTRSLQAAGPLEISFDGPCWLEVYDSAGTRLAFELAEAGATRAFTGSGPWRVILGNVNAVRLNIGGRVVPIPPTLVVRDTALVSITAAGEITPAGSIALQDS